MMVVKPKTMLKRMDALLLFHRKGLVESRNAPDNYTRYVNVLISTSKIKIKNL